MHAKYFTTLFEQSSGGKGRQGNNHNHNFSHMQINGGNGKGEKSCGRQYLFSTPFISFFSVSPLKPFNFFTGKKKKVGEQQSPGSSFHKKIKKTEKRKLFLGMLLDIFFHVKPSADVTVTITHIQPTNCYIHCC